MFRMILAKLSQPLIKWSAIVAVIAAVLGLTWLNGYQTARSRCKEAQAIERVRAETVVKYVNRIVRVTDTVATTTLAKKLAASTARERSLLAQIEDARRHATTAAIADCRLPDSLRDDINAALSAESP